MYFGLARLLTAEIKMKLLFIVTLLTIFLDFCNGDRKAERLEKLKNEYPGTLTCYECKDPVDCAKGAETLQRKESPKLILKDENPDTAMLATCHIKVSKWSDCRDGPNREGFVIYGRELKITRLQDVSRYLTPSGFCMFRSNFCECINDLCNLEISDIASCEERRKMGPDFGCPREGTTIPYWSRLKDGKEKEQNEKCSNQIIECYKSGYTRRFEITDEYETKQAFLGEGPFTACTVDFFKHLKSPLRVVGRSLSDSNSEKVNRCNCKNDDCTRLTCNCYADKCNNWETLPCTPGKYNDPQKTDSSCEI